MDYMQSQAYGTELCPKELIKTPLSKREGRCGAKWLTVFRRHRTVFQKAPIFVCCMNSWLLPGFFYIYFKARNVQHTKKNCPN